MMHARGLIKLALVLTVCFASALAPFGMMQAKAGHMSAHGASADHMHHGHMAHAHHHHGAVHAAQSEADESGMPGHKHGKDCHAACCPHVIIGFRLGPPVLVELTNRHGPCEDRFFASLPQAGPDRPPQHV